MYDSSWIELAARWLLGLTFIYASYHKIAGPQNFAQILYGYGLLPHATINLIAIYLPFLELIVGLALVYGIFPRGAAVIGSTLLLIFMAAITVNLLRGHRFDCGCFAIDGLDDAVSTWRLLGRDTIYLLLGLYLLRFPKPRRWCLKPGQL